MISDFYTELLENIRDDFYEALKNSERGKLLLEEIAKSANYNQAYEYSEIVGSAMSEAFKKNIYSDMLTGNENLFDLAQAIVEPMLGENHKAVSEFATLVQNGINQAAGFGIKAQPVKISKSRVKKIVESVSSSKNIDEAVKALDTPITTFSQRIVDETLRTNAKFNHSAGINAVIERRSTADCCEWCKKLDGKYKYHDVPRDVYRRHDNCRCSVDYKPDKHSKTVQNVHSKQWTDEKTLEERKTTALRQSTTAETKVEREKVGLLGEDKQRHDDKGGTDVLAEYMRSATPGKGKIEITESYDRTRHAPEIKMAQWLHDNLGGDIVLLDEECGYKIKTPDFFWRNKMWDLKSVTTEKSANSAIRHGLKQISEKPGGIILDYSNNEISITKLTKKIDLRMEASGTFSTDILILQKNHLIKVLRYKK